MIKYEPTDRVVASREAIIIDGEKIGEIWVGWSGYPERQRYQCQITAAGGVYFGGIGETKEEAIRKAIEAGRRDAALLLAAADRLEAAMTAQPGKEE